MLNFELIFEHPYAHIINLSLRAMIRLLIQIFNHILEVLLGRNVRILHFNWMVPG